MGKQTPQAPTPPDVGQLLQQQSAYSLINQQTPYGSLTFSGGQPESSGAFSNFNFNDPFATTATPADSGLSPLQDLAIRNAGGGTPGQPSGPMGPGSITATQTLTPELQRLFDSQISNTQGMSDLASTAQSRIGGLLSRPINQNFGNSVGQVRDAVYDKFDQLTSDDFAQQEERLRQQLADRGLPSGSEAFDDELSLLRENQGLMRNQAALDAVLAGGQEQSRLFGMDSAARGQEFNELASLMGGQQVQVPGLDSFMAPGGVDSLGANALAMQGANNAYNSQVGQQNAKKGGVTQLGSAGILGALSSRELKEEVGEAFEIDSDHLIDRLGKVVMRLQKIDHPALAKIRELPVKAWRYLWDDTVHVGPYAEDVRDILGIGDGRTIPLDDFVGVLSDSVDALEVA